MIKQNTEGGTSEEKKGGGQAVLDEYTKKPYHDNIFVPLLPRHFRTNPFDATDRDIRVAFNNLPGNQLHVIFKEKIVEFKFLGSGYVLERNSLIEEATARRWSYSIQSGKEFLRNALQQIASDLEECEEEKLELVRKMGENKNQISRLEQSQASLVKTLAGFP